MFQPDRRFGLTYLLYTFLLLSLSIWVYLESEHEAFPSSESPQTHVISSLVCHALASSFICQHSALFLISATLETCSCVEIPVVDKA